MKWKMFVGQGCLIVQLQTAFAGADVPTFDVDINQHIFAPDIIVVPANIRLRLVVHNHDKTPEEFKSRSLNVKKIIMGEADAVVFIGPLTEGDYQYVGAFYPRSANGIIHAQRKSVQP